MTGYKKAFSIEEIKQLNDVVLYMHHEARSFFSADEWKALRSYVHTGIRRGAFDRDEHGVSGLLLSLQSCRSVNQDAGLKQASMLTSLLYPLVHKEIITVEEVLKQFGKDTAHLIACMTRVMQMYDKHDSKNQEQTDGQQGDTGTSTLEDENFRKLLLSMAEDIRVVICLIANRYVLMRLLNHNLDVAYRHQVTKTCQLLYTPMSHRLGLYSIKRELEDMTLKYEDRATFDNIAQQLQQTKTARDAYMEAFIAPLEKRLRETTHLNFYIKGRTKSISSIQHKLQAQQTSLDKIFDLFAIRIIIDEPDQSKEKADCWQAYSIVTDMYQPNPKRLKDWLSIPKSNGYESLHITVAGPDKKWVEVQIRTKRMDEIAERGLAAHWLYKGIKSQGAVDQVMASIREILEHNSSPDEIMKDLSLGLYQEEIFVFTPRGDVFKLPKGATVLDLAFSIHSKLGLSCVGAKVGNKNVKINYQLHSGDQVEILTSPQQTPKQDWLNIVATSKARMRIRQGLKEIENREAEAGKELLQRRFKNRKIDIEEGDLSKIVLRMGFKTQTQFFHALAIQEIDVDDVLKAYDQMQAPVIQGEPDSHSAEGFDLRIANNANQKEKTGKDGDDVLVIDKDLKGLDYSLAGCCHPIYGDDVVGFVSISGGIRIHRADCINIHNLQEQYPYRIVRAKWSGKSGSQYSITLRVIGQDDIGIVSNISSVINKEKDTLLRAINIDAEGGLFRGHLTVMVQDLSSLNSLIKKISAIKGVKQVERVN